jgi:thiamine pyrophosphate-dependent acetolactate synthase large subunit-like protein
MGMGLVTPVAMGIALGLPHRKVIALDGDGSMILGLGTLTTLGKYLPPNLIVIVFDNESYFSCTVRQGGESLPTATAERTDLAEMARGAGIKNSVTVTRLEQAEKMLNEALESKETWFIVAKTEKPPELVPRPRMDGDECKYRFVRFIEKLEKKEILPAEGHALEFAKRPHL